MVLFFYFSRVFLLRIFLVWLFFLLLIVIGDTIESARGFGGKDEIGYLSLFILSLLRAPYFTQDILPFAIFFASLLSLYILNRRLELVVVRASGISVWQFLFPFCFVAFVLGIFSITVYDPLSLRGLRMAKNYESNLLVKAGGGDSVRHNRWHRLARTQSKGDVIIRAALSREDGLYLSDVSFYIYGRQGNFEKRYDSMRADFSNENNSNGYLLQNARDVMGGILPEVFIPLNIDIDSLRLQFSDANETDFWSLRGQAFLAQNSGRNPLPFEMRYFHLLSLPFLFVAMVLISACVPLLFLRFGNNRLRFLVGIFCAFVFYAVAELVLAFGENGLLPILLVAYCPSLLALLLSASMILHLEDG